MAEAKGRRDRRYENRVRKGTRMLRQRTMRRAGALPGQPALPADAPEDSAGPERHFCAECFGPRSMYSWSFFCERCERQLFGWRMYQSFLRSEAARERWRRIRAAR